MGGGIYPSSLLNNVPQSLLLANNATTNNGSRTSNQSLMISSFDPTSLPIDLGGGGMPSMGLVLGEAVELRPMHSYQAHHTNSGSASFGPYINEHHQMQQQQQQLHHQQQQQQLHPRHTGGSNNGSSNNQADSDESPMVGVCVQQSPVVIH